MKKVWTYFAIGCVVAIIGMFFSDICGDFFNGMDYGSACVLGIGMYLCVRRDLSRWFSAKEYQKSNGAATRHLYGSPSTI